MAFTMSIKRIGLVVVVALACLVALPPLTASADITLPEEFYGDITINNVAAPAGITIVATIAGVERGSFVTTEAGKYGGPGTFDSRLVVAGEEAEVGETITFWVNGALAKQTAIYEPGESKELNLSAPAYPLNVGDIQITKALDFLRQAQQADGSISTFATSAWAVMAIAAAGEDPDDWTNGGDSIVDYLRDNADKLDEEKATDWERSILAIVAAGEDPTDFGGVDYVDKLLEFYDGNQMGSDGMLNDDFWGILVLVAVDEDEEIIADMKDFIISNQNADGGWGWTVGGNSDADNTAAAISALFAAGESSGSETIADALDYLKSQQQSNGGITSEGSTNSGVNSWVIIAINDVGQDPIGEEWRKSGNNPVDYLLSLQDTDGAFKWSATQRSNPEWMTAYAIPALLGKSWPTDTTTGPPDGDGGGGGGGIDRSPPRISNISCSDVTETTADIYWKTHEKSDSQVEYWASEHKFSELDEELVYSHHVHLTGLTPGTTYKYVTISQDKSGNEARSDEEIFTTLGEAPAAAFSSSELSISPRGVNVSDTVTISVLITNTGNASGSREVTLKINGVVEATKELTLEAGASERVSFTTVKEVAGSYSVEINGLSGSFTVKEGSVASTLPGPPSPSPENPAEPFNWSFIGGIIVGAVVVVVALLIFLLARRQTRW
jgi:hypothetical protein